MTMKPWQRLVLPLALATGAVSVALAYNIDGTRWDGGRTVFHVGMSGTSASGQSWSAAFEHAMATWNAHTGFTFLIDDSYVDPCSGYSRNSDFDGRGFPAGDGDDHNSMGFSTDVCGNDFGTGVLAITLSYSVPGTLGFADLVQTDIIFNANQVWDIYGGQPRNSIDFGRVALHELGHALGLNHEQLAPAIMAPRISALDTLQPDDIAGANAIYGKAMDCLITDIGLNAVVNERLGEGDCRILDLFGGSDDTSFVDVYRIKLPAETVLDLTLTSSEMDPVLIITDSNLGGIQIHDDFADSCDARVSTTLPAGDYLLLVNTYVEPDKCAGNAGTYSLTVSNSVLPVLGPIRNASGAPLVAAALITGGASASGSASFKNSFAADDAFDVQADIAPDPQHVGLEGSIYVLATLDDGRRFMKTGTGKFVPFSGDLSELAPLRTGDLKSLEHVVIADDLRGTVSGLAGQGIRVHVGYAMASSPRDIYYGSMPIRLVIGPG